MNQGEKRNLVYKDPTCPVEERVSDLLKYMTLDEKVSQLGCTLGASQLTEDIKRNSLSNGIGEIVLMGDIVMKGPECIASTIVEIQRYLIEETRLGIPAIFHIEALAGGMYSGATNFPIPLAVSAAWHPELLERMADSIRRQMVSVGYRQALSPVMDIARDPRWGRVGETYGEDPYLVSSMSVAFVKGLQTADIKNGAVATAKHFLGYGSAEGALNTAVQHINERELYEVYARPFEAAIHEAGLASVMNSYGEIDGIPIYASKKILTQLLRDTLKFDGFVVSDYMSIDRLVSPNLIAEDIKAAGVMTLQAGLDMELPNINAYGSYLREAVKEGKIDISYVDDAVKRILRAKFQLGLFDDPYPRMNKIEEEYTCSENNDLSYNLAAESIVLLKNKDHLLPLSPDTKRIAVIGPNADSIRNLFGGYTYAAMVDMFFNAAMDSEQSMMGVNNDVIAQNLPKNAEIDQSLRKMLTEVKTVLESIRAVVSKETEVVYEEGCSIKGCSTDGFDRAVEAAKKADCAILVMGGKHGWGDGSTSGEGIDASTIGFFGVQEELLKKVHETGTPVILVHIDGRPLSCPWASEKIPAILEAWAPGQEGAKAIADIIFGYANPGGKLPLTIARGAGQLPNYYNHHNGSGYSNTFRLVQQGYINESNYPLYCFGHGLTYTNFEYTDLNIEKEKVDSAESVNISFMLKNTGDRNGDEIVQLYIRDCLASVVRPVKELVGFKRVSVSAGETIGVTFTLDMKQLAFLDREMNFVVEPGVMEVFIGSSSEDIRLKGSFEIVGKTLDCSQDRVFFSSAEIRKIQNEE